MNSKHKKTHEAIFADPVLANIPWDDIDALLVALGAFRQEGNGSRTRYLLNGVPAVFHRPHPRRETDRGAVKSVRKFLIDAGEMP
ncbi:MAG: type II toxin-antitoxin system HicA family toxin [Gammaproteobacteria bacterium]